MKTPADKRIVFTLYSHPMKNVKHRWKAHLAFNPGSTDDSSAELDVMDGEGAPIERGTFEFAGQRLTVRNGRALLRCGDFAKGKHEAAIWLYREGIEPVPGALTFE